MRRRISLVVGLLIGVALVPVGGTSADGDCFFDPATGKLKCRIDVPGVPGGPGGDPTPGGPGETTGPGGPGVPLVWDVQRVPGPCPPRAITNPDGTTGIDAGEYTWIRVTNTQTGEIVMDYFVCLYSDDPTPAPPPAPPTAGEFGVSAADTLTIDTLVSPKPEYGGVTQLDMWLWCDAAGPVTVPPLTVRGWTARASMSMVHAEWVLESPALDSAVRLESSSCGGPSPFHSDGENAAAVWTPRTMGDYTIDFTTTWSGSWTLSYGGVTMGTFSLGPLDFPAPTVPYDVAEIVAVSR